MIFVARNPEFPLYCILFFQPLKLTCNVRQIVQAIAVLKIPDSYRSEAVEIDLRLKRAAILTMRIKARSPREDRGASIQNPVDGTVCKFRIIEHPAAANDDYISAGDAVVINKPHIMAHNIILAEIIVVMQKGTDDTVSAIALIHPVDKMQDISSSQHSFSSSRT